MVDGTPDLVAAFPPPRITKKSPSKTPSKRPHSAIDDSTIEVDYPEAGPSKPRSLVRPNSRRRSNASTDSESQDRKHSHSAIEDELEMKRLRKEYKETKKKLEEITAELEEVKSAKESGRQKLKQTEKLLAEAGAAIEKKKKVLADVERKARETVAEQSSGVIAKGVEVEKTRRKLAEAEIEKEDLKASLKEEKERVSELLSRIQALEEQIRNEPLRPITDVPIHPRGVAAEIIKLRSSHSDALKPHRLNIDNSKPKRRRRGPTLFLYNRPSTACRRTMKVK